LMDRHHFSPPQNLRHSKQREELTQFCSKGNKKVFTAPGF